MNEQQFASGFATVISILGDMSRAVGDNASLLGCLNIEEYQLFQNLIKEMAWYGGGLMLYFAYGFGASVFLAFPLVAFGLLKRAFRAGFEVSMD